jgi:hypothetical protein
MANTFTLRFDLQEIHTWAGLYPTADDHLIEAMIAPRVRERGYFTKPELIEMCRWKTPRSGPRVASNPDEFVQTVTQTALSTADERLRIEVLTLLHGVSWPTASVLLHFGHCDPYPILDFRALWSLGVDEQRYNFAFWWDYMLVCRSLAEKAGVSMRTLDRALWAYSKEHQKQG